VPETVKITDSRRADLLDQADEQALSGRYRLRWPPLTTPGRPVGGTPSDPID
jgi:hypothetical protein